MRARRTLSPLVLALGAAAALLAPAPECRAFRYSVHADITREALEDDSLKRTVNGSTFTFTDRAIEEIQFWNQAEDLGPDAANAPHHFDNERFADGSQRLLNLKERIVDAVSGTFPDGIAARRLLGSALHTIQDWYSHTNWIEVGNTGTNQKLGRATIASPSRSLAVCGPDQATLSGDGLTNLTSGYFKITSPCDPAPTGKCLHGFRDQCQGIHKDYAGRPHFEPARALAVDSSIDFVDQILDAIAANGRAVRALMGRSALFAVAIDDSFSMTSSLAGVKSTIADTIGGAQGLSDGGGQFFLTTFGSSIDARRTADRDEFAGWVQALEASEVAGDLATPAMTATLRTIAKMPPGTTLFVVTDAVCSDRELAPAVLALANQDDIRIVVVATGLSAQIDPCYGTVAEGSGGVVLGVDPADAGKALERLRAQIGGELETVLAAEGTLAGAREFTFPVECNVTELVVTATVAGLPAIEVTRPGGALVVDADSDATVTNLASGTIVRVSAPTSGDWKVRLDGSGHFAVRAEVQGKVAIDEASFVTRTLTDHAPLVPELGEPRAAVSNDLAVRMSGGAQDVSFVLVDEEGTTLQSPSLAPGDPDEAANGFLGSLVPPTVPFRLVASGKDATGCAFRRTSPALFTASSLHLELDPESATGGFTAGATTNLRVLIVNDSGTNGTFELVAFEADGHTVTVTPAQIDLGPGESGVVDVAVNVPEDTRKGESASVTLAAVDQTGTRANTLTVTRLVTEGSLRLSVRSVRAQDKRMTGRDVLVAGGRFSFDVESPDDAFDIAQDEVRIEVGSPADPFVFVIPAGDPGWHVLGHGKLDWRSEKGATPKVHVAIDPTRRTFSLQISRFDFPHSPRPRTRVSLRLGNDVGTATRVAKK